MNKIFCSISALLLLAFSALANEDQKPARKAKGELVVMTYNIHHCNPPSAGDKIEIAAIADVIRKENPDFVALQEVDVDTERSGKGVNQAKEIARLLGMNYFFSKGINYQGGEYGIAILSRFAITDSFRMPLPVDPVIGGEPRSLATVTAEVAKGKKVVFACTHLDLKEANRIAQAKLIVEHFQNEKLPVILGGDFNAKPKSSVINYLDTHFARSCMEDCLPTIPVENPDRTIDFIMFKTAKQVRQISTRVISEKYASDHLPVVVRLKLN